MFCNKCGFKFDGNFCPSCGAKSKKHSIPKTEINDTDVNKKTIEENPYDIYYNKEPINVTYDKYPYVEVNQTSQQQTVPQYSSYQTYNTTNEQSYDCKQTSEPQQVSTPPNCPLSPSQPPIPHNKPLSFWQILIIVLSGVLAFSIFTYGIPLSFLSSPYLFDSPSYEYDETSERTKETEIGETVDDGTFSYCITKVDSIDTYKGEKPKVGCKFISATIYIKNISGYSDYLDYELSLYADDMLCNSVDHDYPFNELLPNKSYTNTYVFELPKDFQESAIYISDYYGNYIKVNIN